MIYLPLTIALVALLGYRLWLDRQRVHRLRAVARARGLRYSRSDLLDVHQRYAHCVLMRVGHGRRAWDAFFGARGQHVWVGFFDAFDVGMGGERSAVRRCVAAMEGPFRAAAVLVPAALAASQGNLLETPMGYLAYAPAECGETRSHRVYVRSSTAAVGADVRRFAAAAQRSSGDWVWEMADGVLLAASSGPQNAEATAALLDAVAAAADEVLAATPTERDAT